MIPHKSYLEKQAAKELNAAKAKDFIDRSKANENINPKEVLENISPNQKQILMRSISPSKIVANYR